MGTFTYEYLDKSGARRSEVVEAASRAEAIAKAKEQGRTIVTLTEGGTASKTNKAPGAAKNQARPWWLLAAGACIILAGLLYWCLGSSSGTAKPKGKKSEVRRSAEKSTSGGNVQTNTSKVSAGANATVVPAASPAKSDVASATNGTKKLDWATLTNDPNVIVVPRKQQIFHTSTEQVLNFIFNAPVGSMPPPLPTLPGYEMNKLEEILDTKNVVGPDDSPEVKERKEMVERAKKELKDYLAQGGDAGQFLRYYHGELRKAYEHKMVVQKQVMEVLAEQPDIANDFIKKVNADLEKQGITPVKIPKRVMERYGLKTDEQERNSK